MSSQSSQSAPPRTSTIKRLEATRRTAYIASQNKLPTLPIRTFDLEIFTEERRSRSKLAKETHQIFEELASIVLTHLITSSKEAMVSYLSEVANWTYQAEDVFRQQFAKEYLFIYEFQILSVILSFLFETNRPTVVFARFQEDAETLVWGEVYRDGDDGSRNEMFLSMELMEAISGEGSSEIGSTSAQRNLGFVLEMVVKKSANTPGSRLWHPDTRIIARLPDHSEVLLDAKTIEGIYESFSKEWIWKLKDSLDISLHSYEVKDSYIRLRVGSAPEDDEEVESQFEPLGLTCGRRYVS
ncbi:hypothetical protein BDP27DRAFT_1364334 [Rhodocollybia butyracea]|uniref:Uncharacterized protein n=1 Tax=Rhodocollybia butyracea TaxID=206335 RepID=A0A9P5U5U6_9AGAR|nr:hypothetical protein BDP27DRAFT_1364334 [Rhodocollybia butyracea]